MIFSFVASEGGLQRVAVALMVTRIFFGFWFVFQGWTIIGSAPLRLSGEQVPGNTREVELYIDIKVVKDLLCCEVAQKDPGTRPVNACMKNTS